ncbi:hypothetical protein RND81_14G043500 [Saponaria officinalis]|uniref:Pentatricopeptide repeat-containing protein n=1 Tax=Saponaria officinalis TaxID=3572 RepID=A0AAW1GSD3_SAPOF
MRTLLNKFPSFRHVTQQIHSQLTINGSLNQSPNTRIIFVFNTILRRYALGEFPKEAIFLYKQVTPSYSSGFDSFTYSFLVKSCAKMWEQFLGFQFHGIVVQLGFECNVYVQTALLNMYVDFGFFGDAYKVFDEMPERNLVTWNVLITGLVKWGHIREAESLFRKMPEKNVVSWTSMIDGFTSVKNYLGAFNVFREMIVQGGIMPTEVSLLAISKAITGFGDLNKCRSIHAYSEKCGYNASYVQVANCLIDTYAKCGCITSASRLFEEILTGRRNLVTWTSMVAGFAMHGMAKEAKQGFEKMQKSGIKPNGVTFLSVLNAYSHSGLVQDGVELFERMIGDGFVTPDLKHYGAVVDMLGRAGRLNEADEIANRIENQIDSVVIWRTILGACSVHGHAAIAERATWKIQAMERGYGGDYVLMSNILTNRGKFSEAEEFRTLISKRNITKISGRSAA